jgi:hypothetical protein
LICAHSININCYSKRWIEKYGGLDNYLLFTKEHKIGSKIGLHLRGMIKEAWEKKEGRPFDRRAILYEFRKLGESIKTGKY